MDNEALAAAKQGNVIKLYDLLDECIDVNAKDAKGRTLLHHATSSGHRGVIKCLLQNGADAFLTNGEGNTALDIATSQSDDTIVDIILENVARDKLRKLLDTKNGVTGSAVLHVAASNDFYQHASLFLEFGANFEIANDAGKRPIDLTRSEDLRALLELIDRSFARAKSGDKQLTLDLDKCNAQDFTSVLNCRNSEGLTIMQVLLKNNCRNTVGMTVGQLMVPNKNNEDLSRGVWALRMVKSTYRCLRGVYSRSRKAELDELAERIAEWQEFHAAQKEAVSAYLRTKPKTRGGDATDSVRAAIEDLGRMCCRELEKAHEVLLAHRKFAGERMSLTVQPEMKTIEEALEMLGLDPDELAGRELCYYDKLPIGWKRDVHSFTFLLEGIINRSIDCYAHVLNATRLDHAVHDDDVARVEILLGQNVKLNLVYRIDRTVLCYAAKRGNKKIVDLLLTAGAKVVLPNVISPVYLAANKGKAKVVEMLLEHVDVGDMAEFVDSQQEAKRTALHAAAKKARLDIVKTLLRHGATYAVLDGKGRTPLDVSTSKKVADFLRLVDECFEDAKRADVELVHKLKAMPTEDFTAIAGARNLAGQTLAAAAVKANAKNIAVLVLRMIREAKQEEN